MRIVRIRSPQGRRGHYQVVLDSAETFRVRAEDIEALCLRVNTEVDERQLEQLRARDGVTRAAETAYQLLSIRTRSRQELADRLRRRGISDGIISKVLTDLEAAGLVDDIRFAATWVRGRMALRPSGAARLRWELVQKGVAREVIDRTLHEALNAQGEKELAFQVARARLRFYRGLPYRITFRRLAGVLQRRGFSPGVIASVLREAVGSSTRSVEE